MCRLLDEQISCMLSVGKQLCLQKKNINQPETLNYTFIRENFNSILLPFGRIVDKYKTNLNEFSFDLDMLFPEALLDHCQEYETDIPRLF